MVIFLAIFGESVVFFYLILIAKIGNISRNGNDALLTIRGYILGYIWLRNCVYWFDCHRKDSEGKSF